MHHPISTAGNSSVPLCNAAVGDTDPEILEADPASVTHHILATVSQPANQK